MNARWKHKLVRWGLVSAIMAPTVTAGVLGYRYYEQRQQLEQAAENLSDAFDREWALEDRVYSLEDELAKHDPRKQIFEAAILSSKPGMIVEPAEGFDGWYAAAADTIEIYLGFNPQGLIAEYRYSDSTGYWSGIDFGLADGPEAGYNKLVCAIGSEFYPASMSREEVESEFSQVYMQPDNLLDDTLHFVPQYSLGLNPVSYTHLTLPTSDLV